MNTSKEKDEEPCGPVRPRDHIGGAIGRRKQLYHPIIPSATPSRLHAHGVRAERKCKEMGNWLNSISQHHRARSSLDDLWRFDKGAKEDMDAEILNTTLLYKHKAWKMRNRNTANTFLSPSALSAHSFKSQLQSKAYRWAKRTYFVFLIISETKHTSLSI